MRKTIEIVSVIIVAAVGLFCLYMGLSGYRRLKGSLHATNSY